MKVKQVLSLGVQRGHNYKAVHSQTVPEQFNPNISMCAVHFTEDYFLNQSSLPAVHKDCFYKALQAQSGASESQPVSMFSYLKNLPLTIQTRVL